MRIKYIDVAKGIAILLVLMVHVGMPEPFIGAYAAKVPVFFFIAGLFFIKSLKTGKYLSKKFKSILFPFILYYLISYSLFYLINVIKPDLITGEVNFSIFDPFKQRQLFNGPLWYLLSLFEVELIFFCIYSYIKKEWLRAITIIFISSIGFLLSYLEIFVPLWFDTSCVALLYFYMGYFVSIHNIEQKSIKTGYLIIGAVFVYLLYLLMPVTIAMSINKYSNYILAISSGALIVLFILIISKLLDKITLLAWIGSNSLVILCTHHLVYRPIKAFQLKMGLENPYMLFLLTLIFEIAIILIINRWLPILAGKFSSSPSMIRSKRKAAKTILSE